ncbi:MAG: hypothetical protein Q9174_003417 [Haloplaca sp. 1 TL-2023]
MFRIHCVCAALVLLQCVCAGFETLEKPFTGAAESAWEALASRNAAAQSRREKSESLAAASASLSRPFYGNNSTPYPTTTIPTPAATSSFVASGASNCNASLQNSYQRMVTDIMEYTVSDGEVDTQRHNDQETLVSFTLTGPTTYTTTFTRAFHPGRPWQAYYPPDYQCCMNCYIYFPNVDVYYWPVPEDEEICGNGTGPLVTAQAEQITGAAKTAEAKYNALARNNSITGLVSTVNAEGFTFISPSVYVAFGDVSAGDACGDVGQKYTSITLGFAPGELQTVTALGKDHYDTTLGTRPFDPKNVLCPPDFEVEDLFLKQDRLAGISTYRPRIQIPPALQNLDPAWKDCVVGDYEGIDPPHPLVPASGFGDVPGIITDKPPVQEATPAAPIPELPRPTSTEPGNDPGKDPVVQNPVEADPVVADPPKEDPGNPPPGSAGPGSPAFAGPAVEPVREPSGPAVPRPDDPANSNGQPGGVGNSPAEDGPAKEPVLVPDPTKAIQNQGQPAAVVPEVAQPKPAQPAIVVQDQTIKEGDDPVTIDGKPVVYSQGSTYVGGVAAPAPTAGQVPGPQSRPKADAKPNPVSLDGFEFTPVVEQPPTGNAGVATAEKPAIGVEGQTIKQGAPASSVNGHEVIYSGDTVRVDGSPIPIPPVQPDQPPKPVTANGLTFTPISAPLIPGNTNIERPQNQNQDQGQNPEKVNGPPDHPVVVVKGQSITENGAPATINGRTVVYSGGAIYVAGTRAAIPTIPPSQPGANPVSVAGLKFTPLPLPPANSGQDQGKPAPAVVVAGQTLSQNAPAIVVDGATLAYSSGSVFVNGKAAGVPTEPASLPENNGDGAEPLVLNGLTVSAAPTPTPGSVVTTALPNGQTISRNPSGNIIIKGTTLSPDNPAITISGTTYSLNNDQVVINGTSTIPLPPTPTSPAPNGSITPGRPLSLFGSTITPDAAGVYVVAGITITPNGPAATISGTRVSLGAVGTGGAVVLAVGSSTRTLGVSGVITGSFNDTTFSTGAVSATGGMVAGPTGDPDAGSGDVAPLDENSASRSGAGKAWWVLGLSGVLWLLAG